MAGGLTGHIVDTQVRDGDTLRNPFCVYTDSSDFASRLCPLRRNASE